MDREFQLTSHIIAKTRRKEQKLWPGQKNGGELEPLDRTVEEFTFLDRKFWELIVEVEVETLLEKEKVEMTPSAQLPPTPLKPLVPGNQQEQVEEESGTDLSQGLEWS